MPYFRGFSFLIQIGVKVHQFSLNGLRGFRDVLFPYRGKVALGATSSFSIFLNRTDSIQKSSSLRGRNAPKLLTYPLYIANLTSPSKQCKK